MRRARTGTGPERVGRALTAVALVMLATPTTAAMYKCRAVDGGLEYRDTPCGAEAELLDVVEETARPYGPDASGDDDADGSRGDDNDPDATAPAVSDSASDAPADADAGPVDELVGSYDALDGAESLTVSRDGRVLIEDGARRVRGTWERAGPNAYRVSATIYGRALDCDAALDGDRLSLDCPGKASVYARR